MDTRGAQHHQEEPFGVGGVCLSMCDGGLRENPIHAQQPPTSNIIEYLRNGFVFKEWIIPPCKQWRSTIRRRLHIGTPLVFLHTQLPQRRRRRRNNDEMVGPEAVCTVLCGAFVFVSFTI